MAKQDKAKRSKASDEEEKASIMDTVSTVIWALGIAIVLRTFLFQPFTIPSGSMYPALEVGDYVIASKYSVGYGPYAAAPFPFPAKKKRFLERAPKRGDVIIFRPEGDTQNYIKRMIGFPGDRIQMRGGRLFINGEDMTRELVGEELYFDRQKQTDVRVQRYKEVFDNGHEHFVYDERYSGNDDTQMITVPEGYYFFMGDNRDNSLDSRTPRPSGAGYVPIENVMGRAEFVLLSVKEDFSIFKPWTWGQVRGDRFFKGIQ